MTLKKLTAFAALLLALPFFILGCTPGDANSSKQEFAGHSSGEALPEKRYKLDPNLPHAFSKNEAKQRPLKLDEVAPNLTMKTLDGKALKLHDFKGKAVLFMFADTTCPCVKAYDKRIQELDEKFKPHGLRTLYIFSNGKTDTREEVMQFVKTQGYQWPIVMDLEQKLLQQFNAACSTEVFLFDRKSRLRYHGRIDDDTFEPNAVRERDLQSAIVAVLDGRAVPKSETIAFGCAFPKL